MASLIETRNNQTKYIETIGQTLFNNKKLSDITFVVNGNHYHSAKSIMSAASSVFESLIEEKELLKNETDREVVIPDIKHDESFVTILKYIHGININLDTISKEVLCEMIYLSEHYKLYNFHEELKEQFSKLNLFDVGSVIGMLNTAKTYNMSQKYENLKIYVYSHADTIIKDESFVNLNHDILIDLLKSDWLFCREIDILRAVLYWYDNVASANLKDPETKNEIKNIKPYNSEKTKNKNSNNTFVKGSSESEVKGLIPRIEIEVTSNSLSDSNQKGNLETISSENILKTLLTYIRFSRIPLLDYLNSMKIGIFMKYKYFILDESNIAKQNTVDRTPNCIDLQCLGKFTIKNASNIFKSNNKDITYSRESYMVGNHTWTVREKTYLDGSEKYFGLFLECTSCIQENIRVVVEFQITLVSHDYLGDGKNLKLKTSTDTFTNKSKTWGWPQFVSFNKIFDPSAKYISNDTITVEVVISKPRSIAI